MADKKITIDQLAVMIQKSFNATDKKIDGGFRSVNKRLDRIENVLIKKQDDKIEKLEVRMKKIEDALVIK